MSIHPYDASIITMIMRDGPVNGQIREMSDDFKPIAEKLIETQARDRPKVLEALLVDRFGDGPHVDAIIVKLLDHDETTAIPEPPKATEAAEPIQEHVVGKPKPATRRRESNAVQDCQARPVIEISNREYEVNQAVVAELAKHENIYAFGTVIGEVVGEREAKDDDRDRYADGIAPPCVRPMPTPILRERISEVCNLHSWKPINGEMKLSPAHPPDWCVKNVANRGEYKGFRLIMGVVETPTIRRDGTILDRPGYDRSTRLYLAPSCKVPRIPDAPTQDDAVQAMRRIDGLVADFPWRSKADRSVWVAALFTTVARECVDGCTPLFGFDATAAGSGKSLLADVIAILATGRVAPRLTFEGGPHAESELRKRITSIALAGDRLTLLDNVDVPLGGASLDAAITGRTWRDRILGVSTMTAEIPFRTVWLASGNNLTLKGDMLRRTLISRIEPREENPEERSGFHIPDLIEHVNSHRGEIIRDILTVLRAWHVAGRPSNGNVKPLGSFEKWTHAIVDPIVWVGLANPLDVREKIAEDDGQKSMHRGLVNGWKELPEVLSGGCVSVATALKYLKDNPSKLETLRCTLMEASHTSELPSAKSVGSILRRLKGKVVDGMEIFCKPGHAGILAWGVRSPVRDGDKG